MLTHDQKQELQNNDGVVLLQGQREDGSEFFVYMIMSLEQIEKLENHSKGGAAVDFTKYGTVIIAGKGKPSQDHIAYMEKEYHFQHPNSTTAA